MFENRSILQIYLILYENSGESSIFISNIEDIGTEDNAEAQREQRSERQEEE